MEMNMENIIDRALERVGFRTVANRVDYDLLGTNQVMVYDTHEMYQVSVKDFLRSIELTDGDPDLFWGIMELKKRVTV
jgi:hypothetical protein